MAPVCLCRSHRALSSLLSRLLPPPPLLLAPARPPAQNRKGKEVISTGSGSPARKSSPPVRGPRDSWSWRPNQSQALEPKWPPPPPAASCVCHSRIQQNTCPAVATLQATEELWGAPGGAPGCPQAQGGRAGARDGEGRATAFLPPPLLAVASAWHRPPARLPGTWPLRSSPERPLEQEPPAQGAFPSAVQEPERGCTRGQGGSSF